MFRRDTLKMLFNYSIFRFISNIAEKIYFGIGPILISSFISVSVVTHYSIALSLVTYFSMLIVGIISTTTPVFSQYHGAGDYDNIREKLVYVSKISIVMSTAIGGSVLIFGKYFITLWMGKSFIDAYPPLVILIIGTTALLSQIPSGTVLHAIAKHRFYTFTALLEVVMSILLGISLINLLGMSGVALAATIPLLITRTYFIPRYACRQINLSHLSFFYITGRAFVLVTLSQVPLFFFCQILIPSTYIDIILIATVYYSIFGIVMFKIIFSKQEQQMLLNIMPFFKKKMQSSASVRAAQ